MPPKVAMLVSDLSFIAVFIFLAHTTGPPVSCVNLTDLYWLV